MAATITVDFNQTSRSSGGLRLTQCGDPGCEQPTLMAQQTVLVGKCGLGRDTSIAFGENHRTVFVSFLDCTRPVDLSSLSVVLASACSCSACWALRLRHICFVVDNGNGQAKRASLAVLRQLNDTEAITAPLWIGETRRTLQGDGGKNDICKQ